MSLPVVRPLVGFYARFPPELVASFAHLSSTQLKHYADFKNPQLLVQYAEELSEYQESKLTNVKKVTTIERKMKEIEARRQSELADLDAEYLKIQEVAEENYLAKKHEAKANYLAKKHEIELSHARDLNTEASDLANTAESAKIHSSHAEETTTLLAYTRKAGILALALVSNKGLPYVEAKVEDIIADLELSAGEAAARSLDATQCTDKFRRLKNLGYESNQYFKDISSTLEFRSKYGYASGTIPTDRIDDEHLQDYQDFLIDCLGRFGLDPGVLTSPMMAQKAGLNVGEYIGKACHKARREAYHRQSMGNNDLSIFSLGDETDEAKAIESVKKRRRSSVGGNTRTSGGPPAPATDDALGSSLIATSTTSPDVGDVPVAPSASKRTKLA